ncbi:hypothetical protein HDU84_000720 [Entophlyctis sp. JEL0112]|nr:hypothetical protein HDU84_000720 [Entophlyctis sp. JEL0112]
MVRGDLRPRPSQIPNAPAQFSDAELKVAEWLREHLELCLSKLTALLSSDELALQKFAVDCVAKLIREGTASLRDSQKDSSAWAFENQAYTKLVSALCTSFDRNASSTDLLAHVVDLLNSWDDLRLYFHRNLGKLATTSPKLINPSITFEIISQVKSPQELSGANWVSNLSSKTKKRKHSSAEPENTEKDEPPPQRISAQRKAFSDCWLAFLKIGGLPVEVYKKILLVMHKVVIPHMTQPSLLTDFLTDSYNAGMTDYPDFYPKLYTLLDDQLLTVKYRSRFFRLLDLFLASTYLPAYLVAAFAKRLSRLALFASPSAIVIVIPFVYNLLKRHPAVISIIHRLPKEAEDSGAEGLDAQNIKADRFLMNELDPAKCRALESSLWEMHEPLTKPFYAIEDFLDLNYDALFELEGEKFKDRADGENVIPIEPTTGKKNENLSDVFGGSLDESFDVLQTWKYVHAYGKVLSNTSYDRLDFQQLALRARAHYIAYRVMHEVPTELQKQLARVSPERTTTGFRTAVAQTISELERMLYPWLRPSYANVRELRVGGVDSGTMGIVMTCGQRYFYVTQHLILSLRRVLNVTIPIEVYYGGGPDLSKQRVAALAQLPGVTVINIHMYFPQETVIAGGWAHKAWALLATRFETVLFMDADVAFLRDPVGAIATSPRFAANAQLFFHDRKLWHHGSFPGVRLLRDMVHGHFTRHTRAHSLFARADEVRGTTNEMESGFFALNKSNTGVFFGLLLTTKMNCQLERDEVLYKKVHGDKEAFWFASEALRVPYAFVEDYAGALGMESKEKSDADYSTICNGKLLHLDENRQPFWFHGGSVLSGSYRDAVPPDYQGFSGLLDMVFQYVYDDDEELWDDIISCMRQERTQSGRLTPKQAQIIEDYKDIFRNDIVEVP